MSARGRAPATWRLRLHALGAWVCAFCLLPRRAMLCPATAETWRSTWPPGRHPPPADALKHRRPVSLYSPDPGAARGNPDQSQRLHRATTIRMHRGRGRPRRRRRTWRVPAWPHGCRETQPGSIHSQRPFLVQFTRHFRRKRAQNLPRSALQPPSRAIHRLNNLAFPGPSFASATVPAGTRTGASVALAARAGGRHRRCTRAAGPLRSERPQAHRPIDSPQAQAARLSATAPPAAAMPRPNSSNARLGIGLFLGIALVGAFPISFLLVNKVRARQRPPEPTRPAPNHAVCPFPPHPAVAAAPPRAHPPRNGPRPRPRSTTRAGPCPPTTPSAAPTKTASQKTSARTGRRDRRLERAAGGPACGGGAALQWARRALRSCAASRAACGGLGSARATILSVRCLGTGDAAACCASPSPRARAAPAPPKRVMTDFTRHPGWPRRARGRASHRITAPAVTAPAAAAPAAPPTRARRGRLGV